MHGASVNDRCSPHCRSMTAGSFASRRRIGEEATPIKRSSARAGRGHQHLCAWSAASAASTGTRGRSISPPDRRPTWRSASKIATLQASPGGQYLLYLKADHYWTVDAASGKQTNVTAAIASSFVDRESDDTSEHKPPFGVAGWTTDDQSVLLYDKLDVWEVKPDGSGATKLTNGAAGEIRHRLVRLDPDAEWIDRSQPIYRVAIRSAVEEIRLREHCAGCRAVGDRRSCCSTSASIGWRRQSGPIDIVYASQDFDDSPDYFTSGPSLSRCHAGHDDESVHARVRVGTLGADRLQEQDGRAAPGDAALSGRLHAGAQVSDGRLHVRKALGRRASVLGALRTRLLQRRRVYDARLFLSAARHRVPAARAGALGGRCGRTGGAAGDRDGRGRSRERRHRRSLVGRVRHAFSWRHTPSCSRRRSPARRSPISSATTATITGRAASPKPITSRPDSSACRCRSTRTCRRTSAIQPIYTAHTMQTPLLLEVGDNDGTVHWHQGVELYNIARRAGRNVVLLQYGGEDHGLRKRRTRSTITTGSSSGSITT